MSGETEASVSGWTTDTLKEHVNKQFELRDRAILTALAANEKRLDAMNEFRQTLSDQAGLFMPRSEAEQRIGQVVDRLVVVEHQLAESRGRSTGADATWAYIIGALGVLIALGAIAVGAFT